jgi:hypothetical protein
VTFILPGCALLLALLTDVVLGGIGVVNRDPTSRRLIN